MACIIRASIVSQPSSKAFIRFPIDVFAVHGRLSVAASNMCSSPPWGTQQAHALEDEVSSREAGRLLARDAADGSGQVTKMRQIPYTDSSQETSPSLSGGMAAAAAPSGQNPGLPEFSRTGNPANGTIVLVERGGCAFLDKGRGLFEDPSRLILVCIILALPLRSRRGCESRSDRGHRVQQSRGARQ